MACGVHRPQSSQCHRPALQAGTGGATGGGGGRLKRQEDVWHVPHLAVGQMPYPIGIPKLALGSRYRVLWQGRRALP